MRSRFLLPDGEVGDGVREILPNADWISFADAESGADVSKVEFYVPPYMRWGPGLAMLGRLPSLRAVQLLTAGIDWVAPHMPPGARLYRGVGIHEAAVTELVVGSLLALVKGLPDFVRDQDHSTWAHRRVGGLLGSRAVVLGYGAIGRATGAALEALGVSVTGVGRSARPPARPLADLGSLLPDCDILVVLLPLTDETRGLVDGSMLALLPDGATIVNAARGPILEATALERELVSGRLRAALDVTDPEPLPPENPLWTLPNVLITPHVAGDSELFPRLAARLVADQLERYRDGRPLAHEVVGSY